MQWLLHLGVADNVAKLEDWQTSRLPSARAWLSKKSRQLLGLPPKQDSWNTDSSPSEMSLQQAEEGPSLAKVSLAGPEAASEDTRPECRHSPQAEVPDSAFQLIDGNIRSRHILEERAGKKSSPPSSEPDIRAVAIEPSNQAVHDWVTDGSISQTAPMVQPATVFSRPPPGSSPKHERANTSRYRSSWSATGQSKRDPFEQARRTLSAGLDDIVAGSEGSSAEDKSIVRKPGWPPRSDFLDQGSVSLAYSEHDQSSDTELTDGSANPASTKAQIATQGSSPFRPAAIQEGCAVSAQRNHPLPNDGETLRDRFVGYGQNSKEEAKDSLLGLERPKEWNSEGYSHGPIFVPMVMRMADDDQAMLMRQRYSKQLVLF